MNFSYLLLLIIGSFLSQEAWTLKKPPCRCGWINKGRIVGGKLAQKHEFPWMAGLYHVSRNQVLCGAAIITKRHAITATHCEPPIRNSTMFLVVGLHDIKKLAAHQNTDAVKVGIEKIVVHPTFEKRGYGSDDIAVVVTSSDIVFSTNVGPVCLPTGPIDLKDQEAISMGWGMQGVHIGQPDTLKSLKLTIMSHQECKKHWSILIEPPVQICGSEGNQGLCMGDSGGPLVWKDPDTQRYTLVGVTCFVKETCTFPPPTVFTEVGKYIPWIKQIIQENNPEDICTKE